jgi:hypothetical protein
MWSTASLLDAAGRQEPAFSFAPMTWQFGQDGAVSLTPAEPARCRVLTVRDEQAYSQAMLAALQRLLANVGR